MESVTYIPSAVIALFAIASFVLAFFTYRMNSSIHKLNMNLTMPKLAIYYGLIDEDDREPAYTVVVRNVGQYPVLNVRIQINLEEWRDGQKVPSAWDEYDSFDDTLEALQPQERKEYELPASVESYIVTTRATASNCIPATATWSIGTDKGAVHEVLRREYPDGKPRFGKPVFVGDANSITDLGKPDDHR